MNKMRNFIAHIHLIEQRIQGLKDNYTFFTTSMKAFRSILAALARTGLHLL